MKVDFIFALYVYIMLTIIITPNEHEHELFTFFSRFSRKKNNNNARTMS